MSAKIINFPPMRWRVSWHERDRVQHKTILKWRDFHDHTDAVDWLHHCQDHSGSHLWPCIYNIERKAQS